MMNRFKLILFPIVLLAACVSQPKFNSDTINQAIENGKQANEGYVRSLHFVEGWLTKTDRASGLIPTNLTKSIDVWEPHNSAADNYAFMVLTAYLLDKNLYNGEMLDMLNAEKKLTSRVKSLPDGTSYSVMVLPPNKTMRPELLAKIEELVKQGGVIFGQAPEKSPSLNNYPECDKKVTELAEKLWNAEKDANSGIKKYGDGKVVDELDLKSTLEILEIHKDVIINTEQPVLWTHRTMPGMEIYFLTNQSEEVVDFEPSFRVNGMKPQLWDAVTGEIRALNEFTEKAGRISVPIKMEAHQSWFVVFSNNTESVDKGYPQNFPEFKEVQTIDNEWLVDFQNKDIGPLAPVKFEKLTDWSLSTDEKINYYSGTAIYETTFELTNIPENKNLFIDLGEVCVMAKVKINDIELGGVWIAPYRLNAREHLKKGTNKIEIELVNLWRNQLIKDKKLPREERYTWHLVDDIKEAEDAHPSGLLGPVTILEQQNH